MNRHKHATWAILALALFALAACGGSGRDVSDGDAGGSVDEVVPEHDGDHDRRDYPAQVRENFVGSCQVGGGGSLQCVCALNLVENRMTLTDYIEWERGVVDTGEVPADIMAEVLESCG